MQSNARWLLPAAWALTLAACGGAERAAPQAGNDDGSAETTAMMAASSAPGAADSAAGAATTMGSAVQTAMDTVFGAAGGAGSPANDPVSPEDDASLDANPQPVQPNPNPPVVEDAANPVAPVEDLHNCDAGESPDPRDVMLPEVPDEWVAANGDIDLVVPALVLDWMEERMWSGSHDAWHNIRRCGRTSFGGFGGGFGGAFGGAAAVNICEQTELIPDNRECENARDGYEFLVMHRHMIVSLKQAFPTHEHLFDGFPEFPFEATDVPEQWRNRWGNGWSASILETARTLDDIENNLDQFASEGDLGQYIQCGGMASGVSSIHGALHFKWVVNSSPHSLGNQAVNIQNHMFWKLHGWIDDIWERYRVAKGLDTAAENAQLEEELSAQCWEMDTLGHVIDGTFGADAGDPVDLPPESGEFHENVRPILEETCAGCHSGSSPASNLTLGGAVSSGDIVAGLVEMPTLSGGQFRRVVPGEPEQSWLYLKASGTAAQAGCTGATCNAQVMPPTGRVTLSASELDAIFTWIANGAQGPEQ